jgi:hypothetical protein
MPSAILLSASLLSLGGYLIPGASPYSPKTASPHIDEFASARQS